MSGNPGRKQLRRLQIGAEATPGTAVVATTIWRGSGAVLEDARVTEEVEEDVGIFGGTDRMVTPMVHGKLSIPDSTNATFEQFPLLLSNAFGGPVAGVADGSGSGRIYQTTIPTTSAPTNRAWTLEGGDDREVERAAYAKVLKITLTGAKNKALTAGAELMAREVAAFPAGFTSGVVLPAVEDIFNQRGRVFLDPVGGAYGTTRISNQIIGFKLTMEAHWRPKPTMEGELFFSFGHYVGHKITGEITFEHDTAALGIGGEKENWRNRIPRLLQLRFAGSALQTPGTLYSTRALIINLPIKWTKFSPLDDDDENDIVKGEFISKNNLVAGNSGNIIVVNERASLL